MVGAGAIAGTTAIRLLKRDRDHGGLLKVVPVRPGGGTWAGTSPTADDQHR
ncbi:hypothetical protein [Streptomyces phaeolivaceus]|uniref:hypothetical protein n=1 Tax=Streptomyces phaeolivaceus TaxID=2653200 RepID=UPI00186A13AB|nr:hypothetical protein [Streptomyces phaeolivaceus]